MNTTGIITCPCCGEKVIVRYDDVSGFSIDSVYFSQKLNGKLNAIRQENIALKLQATQQERMDYLLNNISQCCCYGGKYDE